MAVSYFAFFLFLRRCRFSRVYCTIIDEVFFLYGGYVVCFFSFWMVFFYLVTTGSIFYISLFCKNSTMTKIKQHDESTTRRRAITCRVNVHIYAIMKIG